MRSMSISALALAAAALGGHAGAGEPSKEEMTCINRREINAISALDERHALARLRAGRFYLLTIQERCPGFELARRVVLDRSESRICGDGTSLLSFNDAAIGLVRCRIERIDQVADKNAALELIEERAGPQ